MSFTIKTTVNKAIGRNFICQNVVRDNSVGTEMDYTPDDVCYICLEKFCEQSCICPRSKLRSDTSPLWCGCVRDDNNQADNTKLVPVHPMCILEDIQKRSRWIRGQNLFYYKCGYCRWDMLFNELPAIIAETETENGFEIKKPKDLFRITK